MTLRCTSFFLFVLTLVGTVGAQQPVTLSLEKAVQLALEQNSTVIQARNTIEARQSSVTAAYGQFLPSVGISGDWSQTKSDFAFFNGIEIPGGSSETRKQYTAGLGANLTLFNGFANTSSVNLAKANEASAEHFTRRTEQSIVFQTHQLYLNVVRTFQLLKVNEDNLKRSQRQLERITESNKVGAVALADVYRQRVQVGNDELASIRAQNDYEKAKADLLALLAVDGEQEYQIDLNGIPTDIDTNEFRALNGQYTNFPELTRQAIQNRPDYLSALESRNGADASLNIARSAYYPSITTSASYGYDNTEFSKLADNKSLSFRLSVNYNLFNGFSTQEKTQQAEVSRRNSDEQLRQTERSIQVDVKKALLDLEASEKQVNVTQTSVESAEMDRKIAEEKYNLGAGTLLDLLIANANYTTALSNKVNAVTGYVLAKKQVEFVLGTITK
ncbi:MAG: TolC family protein [Ignavibacteriae bacterium]|nr:TolC family protein [Ignavibacteria bacterium]MBI3365926.1 TolC family protein [Ignavibacteriota bacterium]